MMQRFFTCFAVAILAFASYGTEASSTSSRCVEGFYFHDGWCVGAYTSDRISFEKQFLAKKTACAKAFPNGRDVQPAVLTNKGQREAMRKVLQDYAFDTKIAFIGWTPPGRFASGKVGKVVAPSLDNKQIDAEELEKMLGGRFDWGYCDDYTVTQYTTEYDSDRRLLRKSDEYTEGDIYEYEFEPPVYTFGDYDDYSSSRCKYNSPLIMRVSGEISVTFQYQEKFEDSKPLCMYEVPARDSSKTCPDLVGDGLCRFAKPTDLSNTNYAGDFSLRENYSEEDCYKKCVAFDFCKAYEFYGDTKESGTCELHFDEPVKTRSSNHAFSHCVTLVKDTKCGNEVFYGTKPTPSPTPFPTPRPTPSPTPRPTRPTPAPTLPTIPDNVGEYPSCPNNMVLAQCFKPACEKQCGQSNLGSKCPKNADRVCIDLPDPKKSYSAAAEATFLETYCRCEEGLILDSASRKCVKKSKECPGIEIAWDNKCQDDDDNVVVELTTVGLWTQLETNTAKKYENNADLCWIIRAPEGKKVLFEVVRGGKTQAKKDYMEVWDVTSSADATFDALKNDEVDTVLRGVYDGKIKKTVVLEAQAQQMVAHFTSDKKKVQSGLEFWVMYL